jgi:hypothetical protein
VRARGERHGMAKLSMWDVCAIRALFEGDLTPSISRIARAFGLNRSTVRKIRDRKIWNHPS